MRLSELRAAITREGPSPGARAVWWAIASHADGDGNAWPTVAGIARMAGMSERAVRVNLRELERFGMIETTRLHNRRNRYHVVTSAEPQFRFPVDNSAAKTGSTVPDVRKQGSGNTGSTVPVEVHREGVDKGASTSRDRVDNSAATPLRGGGVECTSCRKPIVFATLPSGRKVALDPEPDPTGLYALLDGGRAIELGVYQAARADNDVRGRLRRRHADICEQTATIADLLGATRVNGWREESRARKLQRETGR